MDPMGLHRWHADHQGRFDRVNGCEVVSHYGDPRGEHAALWRSASLIDLSFRGRLCVTGSDHVRFLNGQVTNDVGCLAVGEGCYAALINAKARVQSDLRLYRLEGEILLDFEPGFAGRVQDRLNQFVIADDVEVEDVASHYGLLSLQGPKSGAALAALNLVHTPPGKRHAFLSNPNSPFGPVYVMNEPRLDLPGYDVYLPVDSLEEFTAQALAAVRSLGGGPCGWEAFERARVEAGIPRYGQDFDETNLAPEAGIEDRAICHTKGCYIGQEVISRIRTYGQVKRSLKGLLLPDHLDPLPPPGQPLLTGQRNAGYLTSAIRSPRYGKNIALGYVRKAYDRAGVELELVIDEARYPVRIADLPFSLKPSDAGAPFR